MKRTVVVVRVLAAALALYCLAYGLSRVWRFTIDDAGIVYAYADHIAHGLGPRAVVGGPIVEGYSDFLWVLLLSIASFSGVALPLASKVLGAFFLGVACFAGARLVAMGRPAHPLSRFTEAVPAILLGLTSDFVVWAPSGLENGLFWALLLVLHWLDAKEAERPSAFPWSALAATGLCLTRPEGVVYAGIVTFAKVLHATFSRNHRRQLGRFLTAFVGPMIAYHLVHYAVFREWVPNTYFAKAPGESSDEKGMKYIKDGLEKNFIYALAPVAGLALAGGLRRTLPLYFSAAAGLAFAVYSRGDWMPHYRFVGLSLPPVMTLVAIGILSLSNAFARASRKPWIGGVIALAGALGLSARWYKVQTPRFKTPTLVWCHYCDRVADAEEHRKLLSSSGVSSGTLLTNDFGGPSSTSSPSFQPLDLLGLCDQRFADIEYRRRTRGYWGYESARRDVAFHEGDGYPTLLFFGPNFWRNLDDVPEFHWGYFGVQLTRPGRRDYIPTWMHKGPFLDFFPPVERFQWRTLDDRFVLIGAGKKIADREGDIQVSVSLEQQKPSAERAAFMLRAGGIQGTPVTLFGKVPTFGASFGRGEPLIVTLGVRPKAGERREEPIELGIRRGEGPWVFTPVGLDVGRNPAKARTAPLPFPNALPGTNDRTLLELGERLRTLLAARKSRADATLSDPELGASLAAAGKAAESRGAPRDAYLAYVLATQADRDLIRRLHRKILGLRRDSHDEVLATSLNLLQFFYGYGEAYWHAALVEHFARAQLWPQALYFSKLWEDGRAGQSPLWDLAMARAAEAIDKMDAGLLRVPTPLTPMPVPEFDSDFDSEGARMTGWQHDGKAFQLADASEALAMDGYSGKSFLTSRGPTGGGVGSAQSSSFTVTGRFLAFLLSGSGNAWIELVVDGQTKERVAAPRSRYFYPIFWDVRPHRGKTAFLRVTDAARETDGFIAVDAFRIWPDP